MQVPIERETRKKDRVQAWVWTLVLHAGLLISLMLIALRTPLPLPEEQGVEVAMGFDPVGMGPVQPMSAPATTSSTPQPPATAREELATQSTEESISIPEARKTNVKPKPEPKPEPKPRTETRPEPAKEPVKTEPPKPTVDQKALFPGRDSRSSSQQTQGDGQTPGYQGNPAGTPGATNFQGDGGSGSGISFSLTGRRANFLPVPSYDSQAQGRVVVRIFVNRNGEVTRAIAGVQGSTTTDQQLLRLAQEAALKARFYVKGDAAEEQVGTITYNFIRLN